MIGLPAHPASGLAVMDPIALPRTGGNETYSLVIFIGSADKTGRPPHTACAAAALRGPQGITWALPRVSEMVLPGPVMVRLSTGVIRPQPASGGIVGVSPSGAPFAEVEARLLGRPQRSRGAPPPPRAHAD